MRAAVLVRTILRDIHLVAEQRKLQKCIWRIESELRAKDRPDLSASREERLQLKKEKLLTVNNLIESYKMKK